MRRKLIAVWMILLFALMLTIKIVPTDTAKDLYSYYTENFMTETGSKNAVTAIYLDYRAFDTLFETLLLLVSVIGIIYFSRHGGEH